MSANAVDQGATGAAGGALTGTYPNPGVAVPLNLKSTGTSTVVGAATTGDTVNRVELDADGGIRFGPGGAGALDTLISRGGGATVQVPALTATGIANLNAGANVTGGFVDVATVGKGLAVAEGTNAKQGTAILAAGTVTVANTSVTASSRIIVGLVTLGTVTVPSALGVTSRVAGTSFVILASQATDTSTVWYEIFEPG